MRRRLLPLGPYEVLALLLVTRRQPREVVVQVENRLAAMPNLLVGLVDESLERPSEATVLGDAEAFREAVGGLEHRVHLRAIVLQALIRLIDGKPRRMAFPVLSFLKLGQGAVSHRPVPFTTRE